MEPKQDYTNLYKKRSIVFASVIFTVLAIIAVVSFKYKNKQKTHEAPEIVNVKQNSDKEDLNFVLFYGATCPHCKKVEQWLSSDENKQKFSDLVKKEVYNSEENRDLLSQKAQICKIDGPLGVPFLFDNGKCIIGDKDIIDYLKNRQ